MKKVKNTLSFKTLKKQAAKIKINPELKDTESMLDAPFFKKKMEKGADILAKSALPR